MSNISVAIDAKQVLSFFNQLPREFERALGNIIGKSATVIQGEARKKTPRLFDPIGSGKSSGLLASTIDISHGPLSATIKTNRFYAGFVHEGTRYMRARPFMKLGVEASEAQIQDIAKDEIRKAIGI